MKKYKSNLLPEEILEFETPFVAELECDGATRVLHYSLKKYGIIHQCLTGQLFFKERKVIGLHFWIRLDDGRIIDTKARMWSGPSAPDGIFMPGDYPEYRYHKIDQLELEVTEMLYNILRQ